MTLMMIKMVNCLICSNFVGDDAENIDVGDEVEFTLARKTAKVSAESIRKLAPGTVAPEQVEPAILDGVIVRSMRIVNPEQEEYPGLVQATSDGDDTIYEYGITSLADKRDFLQKGDSVKFQVAVVTATGQRRATHLAAKRKFQKSKVESLKANVSAVVNCSFSLRLCLPRGLLH